MHKPRIHVIDYGLGNLLSVSEGLRAVGAQPVISSDPEEIRGAERLVLPGVGAFGVAMNALSQTGIGGAILDTARAGTPILGICLGMQLLFDSSEEFGITAGLGLIPGRVKQIVEQPASGGLRSTHVGWRLLNWKLAASRKLRNSVERADRYYFVHSFSAVPTFPGDLWASADYGNREVAAVVGSGMVWGSQFHPEKSGPGGLEFLRAFVNA